jgi:hypothetical protein
VSKEDNKLSCELCNHVVEFILSTNVVWSLHAVKTDIPRGEAALAAVALLLVDHGSSAGGSVGNEQYCCQLAALVRAALSRLSSDVLSATCDYK